MRLILDYCKASFFLCIFFSLISSSVCFSGEITDQEWSILGDLKVTYFVGKSGQLLQVDCTAFNEQNKAIGGGFSFEKGGVAVVAISIPKKYQNSDKLKVTCKP